MPRKMLYSNEMDLIINRHLSGNSEWEKNEVLVPVSFLELKVTYFYNKNKNFIIISSPLAVKPGRGDAEEPSYQATIEAIKNQLGKENFGIGCSLLGKNHYIALFKEAGEEGKIAIFDSKISSPHQFFKSPEAPGFFEKVWGLVKAPFNAFGLWAFAIGKEIHCSFLDKDVTLYRLGTQPFFDGVSCGFHSSGAILNIIDLMHTSEVTTEEVVLSITNHKHLDLQAECILNTKDEAIPAINPTMCLLGAQVENNSAHEPLVNSDGYEHSEDELAPIKKEDVVPGSIQQDEFEKNSVHTTLSGLYF
ncbi:hypothetical protein ACD661_11885 [Legionella lytica]|uniref:Uncharacterized protein n=1 Tax=Legionella lytica TaxID=96232 RepID=A0ABW8D962_9GAMM